MLKKVGLFSDIFKHFGAKCLWVIPLMLCSQANALTADDVLNKMDKKEQFSYLAGVVGGFAYSRFLRDKPDESGMKCIYDWYYADESKAWSRIETWFNRHPEKPVEPLLYVLVKKECGA